MKHLLFITILFSAFMSNGQDNLRDYSFTSIDGETINLTRFEGKKLLFINVASRCGFTGQYRELQELHERHGEEVILIGFPCDQFGGQEPGEEAQIKSFCEKNYGVTFLMASKIEVKGGGQHPIYNWLTSKELNGVSDSSVSWNFEKFLIDEKGQLAGHFKSAVRPLSEKITSLL